MRMLRAIAPLALCAVASAADAAVAVAAHAAKVAVDAIENVAVLKDEVLHLERAELAKQGAGGALDVYGALHHKIGLLLDAALLAERHMAAALASDQAGGGGASDADLTELALLEEQLSGLLHVQRKEPLFFWHGPKRLMITRLQQLQDTFQGRLRRLAGAGRNGKLSEAELLQLAGLPDKVEEGAGKAPPEGSPVPAIGVALGEEECGAEAPAGLCSLQDLPGSAGGGAIHVLVRASSATALRRIGSLLAGGAGQRSLWVSLMLGENVWAAQSLKNEVKQILGALSIASCDMLWLPYSAFKKEAWNHFSSQVQALVSAGSVHAFGAAADSSSQAPSVIRKLLDREPKPLAWLTVHDVQRQVEPESLEIAHELGVAVVALSRTAGVPSAAAVPYLEAVAGPDVLEQVALSPRLARRKGLSVVLVPGSPSEPQLGAVEQKAAADLTAAEAAFLALVAEAATPTAPKKKDEVAKDDAAQEARQGLRGALQKGLLTSTNAAASVASTATADAFPGVNAATLEDLDTQRETYKANNHVIYRPNFFDEKTWAAIVAEVKRLWKSEDIEANCNLDGVNRLGGYVLDHAASNTSLYRLIYGNDQFRRWVSEVNNEGNMYPSDFPIEVREYGRNSKGMGCHPDLQMYAVPRKDLEFAVTVDNDSTCKVTFYDANNKVHTVETTPNSVMMVRVNAATHCVSPTHGGTRTILKFIYVGDYRKSREFWHYTGNECDDSNSNVRSLIERRTSNQEL